MPHGIGSLCSDKSERPGAVAFCMSGNAGKENLKLQQGNK